MKSIQTKALLYYTLEIASISSRENDELCSFKFSQVASNHSQQHSSNPVLTQQVWTWRALSLKTCRYTILFAFYLEHYISLQFNISSFYLYIISDHPPDELCVQGSPFLPACPSQEGVFLFTVTPLAIQILRI